MINQKIVSEAMGKLFPFSFEQNRKATEVINFMRLPLFLTSDEIRIILDWEINVVVYEDDSMPIFCFQFEDYKKTKAEIDLQEKIFNFIQLPFFRILDEFESRSATK